MNEVLDPEIVEDDESSLRPNDFDEYIGQTNLKEDLRKSLRKFLCFPGYFLFQKSLPYDGSFTKMNRKAVLPFISLSRRQLYYATIYRPAEHASLHSQKKLSCI